MNELVINTCRYCGTTMSSAISVPTGDGLHTCLACNHCCDCGERRAYDYTRDPLCIPCLRAREERDEAAMEWAAERDAEDRYYREGRYAR